MLAVEGARASAHFGNHRAVLPGHADIIDARAALTTDLCRDGGQLVPHLPRCDEANHVVLCHDRLVVAVAGEGKGTAAI